jgi:lipopolysaccharide assembly protein A
MGAVEATPPPVFFPAQWHNCAMHIVRWIVGATVFIALLFLSLQNSAQVELAFFNLASFKAPLIVVVFVAFATGVALGLLAGVLRSARLKRQIAKLRREHHSEQDPSTVIAGAAAPGTTPASGPGFGRGDSPYGR